MGEQRKQGCGDIELLRVAEAYREAKVLLTAAAHSLFEHLTSPASLDELVELTGASREGLEVLLEALMSMGLVERRGERYVNSQVAQRYLVKGGEEYLGSWLKHANRNFRRWAKLDERVFGRVEEEESREEFLQALDVCAGRRARELAEAVELGGRRRMVDLGGGSGAYAIAFAERYGMEVVVVEHPDTAPVTRQILARKGWGERIRVVSADFLRDDFGSGYDAALISNILHFLREEECLHLLRRVHRRLAEGGVVIVHGFMLSDAGPSPVPSALFGVHMLVTGKGRVRRLGEVERWLRMAGFGELRRVELRESRAVTGVKGSP